MSTIRFAETPIDDMIQMLRTLKIGQIRLQLEDDLEFYPLRYASIYTFITAAREQPVEHEPHPSDDQD
jgi:hypothetical protein